MSSRVRYIDIAKGISIFLVALGHSKVRAHYPSVIDSMSLFRLPLFFFLSGVFFSWVTQAKEFFVKKSEALLKPYFFVLLIIWLINIAQGDGDIAWRLKGIFYGNGDTIKWQPMWFLPHLFAVYVFSYVLFRYLKFYELPALLKAVVLAAFMAIGSMYVRLFWYVDVRVLGESVQLPGLPFSLDLVLISAFYFISGHLLRARLVEFKPNRYFLILSLVTFFVILLNTGAFANLNKRIYHEPFFATLAALSGIYLMLSLAWFLSKRKGLSVVPLRLGQASLYILIFHDFIQTGIYNYFSAGLTNESVLMLLAAGSLVMGVSLPLLIKWVVVRSDILSLGFLPFKSNRLLQRTLYARRQVNS